MTPLDLQRLAVRIETLQRTSTHGWHPADELEFKRNLPQGRSLLALPSPDYLRELARQWERGEGKPDGYSEEEYRLTCQRALDMESLIHRNDPRNPRRIVRDMVRGKLPLR
jgi:hypothetical protein